MGKSNVYYKIMNENQQKREKIWKSKLIYINLHLKDHLQMEFTLAAFQVKLVPEGALT